ncbi:hypothetical protein BMF94_4012 [Rhodotorula taiwanensis]|uniref:Uncharacterized protein n=1 Tax=Rhodotorula taiwanensis TaxID=741276 RepID=A0A2S5B839_9BASI|nr:hypothetical protein BMF94_4012 [Rhodotorula taiwanensis]
MVAFEGMHAPGLLKGVCQRAFDDLEDRRNPSELGESLWHFLELPTKDAIAYLDADASGQAHFASLIRDVPTEGGVCIPFTETVQVDREHKQDWRTPWRHLELDTVRCNRDGKALAEMIRAMAQYHIRIPTPTEIVSASPRSDFPPLLSELVPIRGLGLMLFHAVEELSHHEEEDAGFISLRLLIILLVHELYRTYPILLDEH